MPNDSTAQGCSQLSRLSQKDRSFLNENFPRFGTAWADGLAGLDRGFVIEAAPKWRSIRLQLTHRSPAAVRYTLEIRRKGGGMTTRGPELPNGAELRPSELRRVNEILQREGELWLIEPLNGDVCIRDLSAGLGGLTGEFGVETRLLGRRAVLYIRLDEIGPELLCVWLDLDGGALEGVAWIDVPSAEEGRWLRREDVEFIDAAMREHGDFGVYGNVQDGLRSLATHMELRIREDERAYHLNATPRDGHGHFLDFPVFKGTGEIGACAAGHIELMPDDETPDGTLGS